MTNHHSSTIKLKYKNTMFKCIWTKPIVRLMWYTYDWIVGLILNCFSLFIPLPKITKEGYRVSLSRLRKAETEDFDFADYVKVNFMSIDLRVSKIDMYKKEIFIFDLAKFTMSHLTVILPQVKKFVYCATVSITYFIIINYFTT